MDGWLKAHGLGLTMPERMGYEYTHIVMKYMVNWFNFFLYEDQESWTYLFGKAIQNDITKNILLKNRSFINQSQLSYKIENACMPIEDELGINARLQVAK
jgi:hypothetical protein